jgi:HAD superfamily hydrolase (TIGR01490 family)
MISRSLFNRTFFRNYKGVCSDHLQAWVSSKGTKFWASRLFPFALNEIRTHQNQGNKVFLVTGGLRNIVQPLKELLSADGCIAVEMTSNEGYLTGNLTGDPLTGSVKASGVRRLADEWGLDVTRSYAYADSYADKPFLECVGHPVAVNPDRRLKRLAKQRGWDIKSWKMSDGVEQPKKCARLDSE